MQFHRFRRLPERIFGIPDRRNPMRCAVSQNTHLNTRVQVILCMQNNKYVTVSCIQKTMGLCKDRVQDTITGSGFPWVTWDRKSLPMRNDKKFRLVAEQVARKGATNKQKSKYGVKGLSILSRLSSIDFPRSFPPDSMHLWFENVIPDLVKHWRGKRLLTLPGRTRNRI